MPTTFRRSCAWTRPRETEHLGRFWAAATGCEYRRADATVTLATWSVSARDGDRDLSRAGSRKRVSIVSTSTCTPTRSSRCWRKAPPWRRGTTTKRTAGPFPAARPRGRQLRLRTRRRAVVPDLRGGSSTPCNRTRSRPGGRTRSGSKPGTTASRESIEGVPGVDSSRSTSGSSPTHCRPPARHPRGRSPTFGQPPPPSVTGSHPSAEECAHDQDRTHRRRSGSLRRRRTTDAAGAVPPREARQDRHRDRLRHQQLRRLHRAPRRPQREVVQRAGRAGRRTARSPPSRASPRTAQLHAVQEAFHECHALQCGFCTPGMIMQSVDLLNDNPNPSEEEIRLGPRGQPLSLHRLPQHRQGRADRGRGDAEVPAR